VLHQLAFVDFRKIFTTMNLKKPQVFVPLAIVLLLIVYWLIPSKESARYLKAKARMDRFENVVVSSGELQAENSEKIEGPKGLQRYRIYDIKINDIIPEGTVVKPGDYIASLDRSELTTRINDTQLDLEKAESQYTQIKLDTALTLRDARDQIRNLEYQYEQSKLTLEQSKYEPPATIKQAEMTVKKNKRTLNESKENYLIKQRQAAAKMKEAGSNLQKSRNQLENLIALQNQFSIIAPKEGMFIYERDWGGSKVKAGSQISTWDPVVGTLPDLSSLLSRTYINEVDISKVKNGQQVNISLDAFPKAALKGEVIEVSNMGEKRKNDDSKVFEVIIRVTESDSTYRPGMTTSNRIITNEEAEAILVPIEAVFGNDERKWVYVEKGSITRQEIQTGAANDVDIIVTAGLEEGAVVLLNEPEDGPELKLITLE
jgi:HlyD family secretion protein